MLDHTKLRAFELADEVVLLIYQATRKFPKEEIYGLTSQMRRANAQRLTVFSPWPRPGMHKRFMIRITQNHCSLISTRNYRARAGFSLNNLNSCKP
ncbi:MAG TPA: four helix bundle protein [Desulfatiglandales bacterium]|nr:four helix bundle protein [Desulfatiglandales bacterium]